MGVLQLGSFMIKYEWIMLFSAGIISYFLIKRHLRQDQDFQKPFLDVLVNMVLIYMVIYKFSIVIIRPSILFENPMGILYFTVGTKGYIIASIACILYLIWISKKRKWPFKKASNAFVYSIVTFLIAYLSIRTLLFMIL